MQVVNFKLVFDEHYKESCSTARQGRMNSQLFGHYTPSEHPVLHPTPAGNSMTPHGQPRHVVRRLQRPNHECR